MDPRNITLVRKVRAWPRRVLITVVTIAVVLIGARIALPFGIERQVNRRLQSIPGYTGHVKGIGISLFRGAYTLNDISIFKVNGAAREPFFLSRRIDFSMTTGATFHVTMLRELFSNSRGSANVRLDGFHISGRLRRGRAKDAFQHPGATDDRRGRGAVGGDF